MVTVIKLSDGRNGQTTWPSECIGQADGVVDAPNEVY
jgi:hypothetical protein